MTKFKESAWDRFSGERKLYMDIIIDERLLREMEEEFYKFLLKFHIIDEDGKIRNKYLEKIRDIIGEDELRSVVIDFEDILRHNLELGEKILANPDLSIIAATNALRKALSSVHEDLKEEIVRRYIARFRGIGQPSVIRDLTRADLINNFVKFKAIVVKATRIREMLKRSYFQCDVCGMKFPLEFRDNFTKPQFCPNPNCENEDPRKFTVIPENQEFEEYQELTAQELPEELPPGQLPQSVNIVVRGDLTGKIRPGDRVYIYGILKVKPDRDLRPGKKPLFSVYIESTYIEKETTDEKELVLTEEEKRLIQELKEDKDLEAKIVQSIAPSIYGEDEIKKAIAALLFGGIPKILPDGTKIRGTINVLLVGDPGTGKSQLLKYVAGLAPRAIYTSGKGASAAGLTAAVVKTEDEWALEAGVLVLADKGIACLHPDSRVFVDGKFMRVEDLFNFRGAYKAFSNGEIVDIQEGEHDVVSLDLTGMRIVNSKATVVRRKLWDGELLKIKFSSGNEIIVTPDHLLIDGEMFKWKEAVEFKEGDLVVAPLKLPSVKERIYILDILPSNWRVKLSKGEKEELKKEVLKRFRNLSEFNRFYKISKDFLSGKGSITVGKFRRVLKDFGIYANWRNRLLTYGPYVRGEKLKVPYITPELAYFLGFLYGDGWIQRHGKRVRVCITQSKNSIKQMEMIQKIFLKFYPKKLNEYERVSKSVIRGENVQSHGITFAICSPLLTFLYDYITGNNLENAFKLDDEALKGFIAGVLDSDGCVSVKKSAKGIVAHVEFLLSKDIKSDRAFAMLLRRFNIFARVIEGKSVNKVRITGREDVKKLLESVKNYSVKIKKLPIMKHLVSSSRDKVLVKPVKLVANRVIKQGPSTILLKKGVWSVAYSYAKGRYSPNRLQLIKMLERIGDDVTQDVRTDLETSASRDYFLDEIVSIEHVPYKGYVYDIYVPREHNFIAEGIIVHNCIDEFDKMSGEDRKALHEAMEQLTISIAKAGIVATLNARTSILAAANPKLGRYNEQRSISENINLPPTIISRFDLIFVMKDLPDVEGDRLKTRHVLGLHAGDVRVEPPIPPSLLKKYVMYARENVFPKLTEAAAKKIEEFYLKMRSMSAKEKKEGFEDSPIAITTRQLEALVRLAEAHARMLLKDEVDEEDAQFAIELVKYSLEQVGKDPESGEIDTGVIYTGVSHTRRSKYYQVIEIIRNLEKEEEYKDGVPLRKILEVAKERNIQEDFVIDVIRREVQSGNIYEPKSGRYKLIY